MKVVTLARKTQYGTISATGQLIGETEDYYFLLNEAKHDRVSSTGYEKSIWEEEEPEPELTPLEKEKAISASERIGKNGHITLSDFQEMSSYSRALAIMVRQWIKKGCKL